MDALTVDHAVDFQLQSYWQRRVSFQDALSESEWSAFYSLVVQILTRYRPRELASLPETPDYYIQEFFYHKVLLAADRASSEDRIHAGALRLYFLRFLRDVLDREMSGDRKLLVFENTLGDADDSYGSLSERFADLGDDADLALREHGVKVEDVAKAADAFLERAESWVGLYLAVHHCPDHGVGMPLGQLAKLHGIANYHPKARQLGITRTKEETSFAGYERTMLGKWLSCDLGIAIEGDNYLAILLALKILCWVALHRAEQVTR